MKIVDMNSNSKRKNQRAMKQMCKDLREVYESTDYSNYEIKITYDAEHNMLIIPKPVMALSIVDEDVHNWLYEQIDNLPLEGVLVA